jgi:hypothetical protein
VKNGLGRRFAYATSGFSGQPFPSCRKGIHNLYFRMNLPETERRKFPIGFGTILFLILLFALLLAGRSRFFKDPGTFWHVRTGEIMLDSRSFLASDPFSYTFGGQPWTPFEWLGEIGMALLNRAGGFDLLLLAAATLIAGTYAWLGTRITRTGVHWAAAVCLTGLAMAVAASHFHVRPHLLTAALLALTMCSLSAVEAGRTSIRCLYWLVPVFIVWSNVHGGVMGGIATVGITFAGWLLLAAWKYGSPIRTGRDTVELCGVGLLILASPLVNPYGLDLPKTWIAIMTMPEVKQIIVEHFPIDPRDPANAPFFALGAVYLFMLVGLRRMPRATWLIPIVWFVLGCDRVRNASLFGIVTLAVIADLFPHTRWAYWLAAKRPDYYVPVELPRRTNRIGFAAATVFVIAIVSIQQSGLMLLLVGRGWVKFDETVWPTSLLDAMHREAGNNYEIPIFNEVNLGGFVIGFAPEYRNFVDDRCELYGGAWLKSFDDANRAGGAIAKRFLEDQQARFGRFDFALTRIGSGFDDCFRDRPDGWICVEQTEKFAFYRRLK